MGRKKFICFVYLQDIIEPMEKEIVGFFGERPLDVLDVEKSDTYYRMIFHAVCQYFGLKSKSKVDPLQI